MRDWQSNRFKWARSDLSGWEGVFWGFEPFARRSSSVSGLWARAAKCRAYWAMFSQQIFLSVFSWYQSDALSCPFGLGEVRTQSSNYRLTHLDFSEEMNEFLCGFVVFTFFNIWALFLSKYVLCFTKLHPEKNEKIKMTAIVKKQPVLERWQRGRLLRQQGELPHTQCSPPVTLSCTKCIFKLTPHPQPCSVPKFKYKWVIQRDCFVTFFIKQSLW